MFEPRLQVFRGGWVAVGDGVTVTASSGQEALLRFAVERRRRIEEAVAGAALREDVLPVARAFSDR
ncbi:MAG TPA: hypothetical protein VMW62_08045 [Chloroflexota bacterium]|nr:hypothetical protein [Chloroflexota bacterium]